MSTGPQVNRRYIFMISRAEVMRKWISYITSLLTKIVNLTVIVPIYWNVCFFPLRWEVANKTLYFNRQKPHLLLPGILYMTFFIFSHLREEAGSAGNL